MSTVAEFAAHLERFAPCATAAEWDNVGYSATRPRPSPA